VHRGRGRGRGWDGLTIEKLIRDGVPILAALQPLLAAPTATGKPDVNLKKARTRALRQPRASSTQPGWFEAAKAAKGGK
jgi:hypothetical protein